MNIMTNQNMNMSYNMNSLPNYNNNMNNMNSYRNSLQNYNNIFNDQNLLPKTEPNYKSHNLNNIFTKNKTFSENNPKKIRKITILILLVIMLKICFWEIIIALVITEIISTFQIKEIIILIISLIPTVKLQFVY